MTKLDLANARRGTQSVFKRPCYPARRSTSSVKLRLRYTRGPSIKAVIPYVTGIKCLRAFTDLLQPRWSRGRLCTCEHFYKWSPGWYWSVLKDGVIHSGVCINVTMRLGSLISNLSYSRWFGKIRPNCRIWLLSVLKENQSCWLDFEFIINRPSRHPCIHIEDFEDAIYPPKPSLPALIKLLRTSLENISLGDCLHDIRLNESYMQMLERKIKDTYLLGLYIDSAR